MCEGKLHVITITGNKNTGKTSLIKDLYRYLVSQNAFIRFYEATGAYLEDFNAVVIYHGKEISLCSIGDFSAEGYERDGDLGALEYIKYGIEIATNYKADILVNVRTSTNMTENDYKQLLRNEIGNDSFKSFSMKTDMLQSECIKFNQSIIDSILKEIEK